MKHAPSRPSIDSDKVCRIVVKARQFGAKEGVVEEDPGSNPADEGFRGVLAATSDDPVYQELKAFIDELDIDDQCELVALTWLGRGDFGPREWARGLGQAHERHNNRTAEYLLGTPLLADYLEEGLDQFGLSCLGFEEGRL
jgi:hypothetical protein